MSSPLSQDLAAKIIEVLTVRGHVLLSKGGRPTLVRDLAERMNDKLATIIGRMPPPGIVDNEVTSTFGDEAVDDTVEEMVEDVTASLMDSDQVEDIFSEDAVIRRDVFRVVKDTLLSAERPWAETDEADVEVALTSLGYVATKAAQRAPVALVEGALTRAAKTSSARLVRYSPETQSATFRAALATPDARLELEEAVADELSSLVDEGKVALPTIERTVQIGRATASDERAAARTRVDIAATRTLLRSGCTATWEYDGDDAISVTLVPMSDQDSRAVDAHLEAFAREVQTIFARPRPAAEAPAAGLDAWLRLARAAEPKSARAPKSAEPAGEPPPASRKPAKAALLEEAASKPAARSAIKKVAAPKKAAPAKKTAAKKEKAAPAKKTAAAKKEKAAPAKKTAAAKKSVAPAKKAAPAKKKAAAKAAPKKAAPAKKKAAAKAAPKKAAPAKKKAAAKKAAPKRAAKVGKPAARPARAPKKTARPISKPAARKASKLIKKPAGRNPLKSIGKPAARKTSKPIKKPAGRNPLKSIGKPAAHKAPKPVKKPAARKAPKPVARKAPKPVKKPAARKPAARKPLSRKISKQMKKSDMKKPAPRKLAARKPRRR